jgi:hypothetical protein
VAVCLWGWLFVRLVQGKGAMLGEIAGSRAGAVAAGRIWAAGELIVLCYSVPIVIITTISLFANDPHRTKSSMTSAVSGIVPIVPIKELAKLVSLQMITTPMIMSIAAVSAGRG